MIDGAGDLLRVEQEVEDWAGSLDGGVQLGDGLRGGGRLEVDRVGDVVRVDGDALEARAAGSRVHLGGDLDLERVERHLQIGGLDEEDVGQAAAENTELQLR